MGWGLTLLPQARDGEAACFPSPATRIEVQSSVKTPGARLADAAFDDMRLHD
ncbi:hypothetical protein J4G43_031115 [Bradyrhizobium barranii subsp. barranii]|uniref:Uncharacterized protein n=1 Tax=Bradyrhizobium barranii subsp. barranii TaxID=2823807 RepID=A0A9X9XND8_9BRAD|nr:hypothetical protein [Bradyrhizobium barranii]UEM09182.1 hypothetical protein J4G43_031115 [Bradyrhizobium barranii subsp. barranii]